MGKYALNRLIAVLPILFGVSIVIFLFLQLVPGDVAATLLGPRATAEKVAAIRAELGLDRPIHEQYWSWLTSMLQGDMGRSIALQVPVADLVLPKFLNTLILAGASLLIAIAIGLPLGILSAVRQYSFVDRISTVFAVIGAAAPTFWLALVLMYIFALELRWFPTSGMTSIRGDGGPLDLLHHLVLPAVATAAIPLAVITRLVRSSMLEVIRRDYITALRAKGMPQANVIYKHALRNALPPIVSITGLQAGFLLGGTLFTEVIFSWPGIGLQLYNAILARDVPVVQGAMLFIAFFFVLLNLLADIIVAYLNPKLRAH
ncbi:ABC transporter permease [Rhodospirillaceae bacterium SYSU D60014]|uniref:ABC transporter permease n=1 Tax=Virgifigura deserti TaxID=2268457 RepID=UPI000E674C07